MRRCTTLANIALGLLDEKGIQHGADAKDDDVRDESPDSGSGEKSGKASRLKEKIKAKLHKH